MPLRNNPPTRKVIRGEQCPNCLETKTKYFPIDPYEHWNGWDWKWTLDLYCTLCDKWFLNKKVK